jgi:hypothetical protein
MAPQQWALFFLILFYNRAYDTFSHRILLVIHDERFPFFDSLCNHPFPAAE